MQCKGDSALSFHSATASPLDVDKDNANSKTLVWLGGNAQELKEKGD
jgi:hypothetical protein